MQAGRPTKYSEEILEQVTSYCLLGATDLQLADFIGVHVDTIYEWKKVYPAFSEAIRAGKEFADAAVARSLYQKAVGGDVKAQTFWLKNRRREHWRDRHTVEEGTPFEDQHVPEIVIEEIDASLNDEGE